MRRYDAEYVALKKLIVDGELGNPLLVHCTHRNPAVAGLLQLRVHDPGLRRARGRRRPVPAGRGDHQRPGDQGGGDLGGPGRHVRPDDRGLRDRVRTRGDRRDLRPDRRGLRGADRGRGRARQRHHRARPEPGGQADRRTLGRLDHPRLRGALRGGVRRRAPALGRRGPSGRTIDGPGAWDGYAAVAVCEAGVEAVRTGQKVPVVLGARPAAPVAAGSDGSTSTQPGIAESSAGITAPDLEGAQP